MDHFSDCSKLHFKILATNEESDSDENSENDEKIADEQIAQEFDTFF